ncbi:ODFP1 protein, partial [Rhinopomastus cyanomelas]|nr:ODFP1 protein [Rhinopomastus cyanomelas]
QRTLDPALNSSHDQNLLTSMDLEGFDPKEISVTVKDGKVRVLAEHEEDHTITNGREYKYEKMMKEITLPPGVSEDEVTYSV